MDKKRRVWWSLQISAATTLSAAAIWLGSLLAHEHRIDFGLTHWIEISRGRLEAWWVHDWRDTPKALSFEHYSRRSWPNQRWNMLPWYGADSCSGVVVLPLWLPVVLTGVPGAVFWWKHGPKYLRWQCQSCGYDARGTRGRICPECGKSTLHFSVAHRGPPCFKRPE